MTSFEDQLKSYGAYHQNKKNQFTHYFGIPLVVLSVFLFLSSARFPIEERTLSLAWIGLVAFSTYYMILNFTLGFIITLYSTICVVVGQKLYAYDETKFWIVAVLTMLLGWGFQFLGHHFEGKRPAFFKNVLHLLNGPLFVAHELLESLRSRFRS